MEEYEFGMIGLAGNSKQFEIAAADVDTGSIVEGSGFVHQSITLPVIADVQLLHGTANIS